MSLLFLLTIGMHKSWLNQRYNFDSGLAEIP
jgi:hypothetical protein